ncbi:MAG: SoxR reducing system RseC family protein [Bacteroidales bacterium]|nr:SoxR reducing system RseC family protein [Bacteroidales bacterium]
MSKDSTIEHKGVVADIKSNAILVDLVVQSACAACHAKSVCGIDSSLKTIEVKTDNKTFNIGDKVKVIMRSSLGMKALFLGYVLPCLVVLATLLILVFLNVSEGLAGLSSLLILGPYYFLLYLSKDKIKREFNFDIEKLNY